MTWINYRLSADYLIGINSSLKQIGSKLSRESPKKYSLDYTSCLLYRNLSLNIMRQWETKRDLFDIITQSNVTKNARFYPTYLLGR